MNATGINTAHNTSTMATTGPATSSMARLAASLGVILCTCMLRSTFSITTIASSTTMPMASTMPNSVSMFTENPSASMPMKVPTIDTGTAITGISVARRLCRNRNTTITTSTSASKKVWITSEIDARVKAVVSITILYSMPSGKVAFMSARVLVTAADTSRALAPGCW
ncbi:hypothetical protein D3C73_1282140 [compost metagenome]